MSKKELKRFIKYLEDEKLELINPNNLSLGELYVYANVKGFQVEASDIIDFIAETRQKSESELSSIEKKWITD